MWKQKQNINTNEKNKHDLKVEEGLSGFGKKVGGKGKRTG